jgi:hypothetical protein
MQFIEKEEQKLITKYYARRFKKMIRMKNKFIVGLLIFSGNLFAENNTALQKQLKIFTEALGKLEKNLKSISISLEALKKIELAMDTLIKQKEVAIPQQIKEFLMLVSDYEKLNPSEEKLKYYSQQAAELFLTYFVKNYVINRVSRQELTEKMSKDFGESYEFDELRDDIGEYADDLPEGQLRKEVENWVGIQKEGDRALQVIEAILKGFDLNQQPIKYTGFPDPKNPKIIQQNAFTDNLFTNYKKALFIAKEIIGENNPSIMAYEFFVSDLKEAIGKMPAPKK